MAVTHHPRSALPLYLVLFLTTTVGEHDPAQPAGC